MIMKAKLIVEGREFPIEIQDPELQKLLTPKKKTGYERVLNNSDTYYYQSDVCCIHSVRDIGDRMDDIRYDNANYYCDQEVARNNARADKLMRQLRRFAVENGGTPNVDDWERGCVKDKCTIYYNYDANRLEVGYSQIQRYFGEVYFNDPQQVKAAIETFHDELIWYFTEYKDSL